MANPRQRRKARSSSHRPISLSRRSKKNLKKIPPIRGPKVLQDTWDKNRTVRQNYTALGLVHSLNPTASGGIEPPSARTSSAKLTEPDDVTRNRDMSCAIPRGFGRIIRDEAGNVVKVDLAPEDAKDSSEVNQVMEEPKITPDAREKWVTNLGMPHEGFDLGGKDALEALERISVTKGGTTTMSLKLTGVGARRSSVGEITYLQRLVDKYGDDVERMMRDRKLNAEQRAAGELRKALKRSGLLGR
ncbi:hypothetical protein AX15_002942 [Amanita polypyramis BW_CC]|nr:hypothetical protein AX15_002942 [Amanita polypyramis BW_CC]